MSDQYGPEDLYAPNQQVVHRDVSGPAEEGDGGPPGDQNGGEEVPVAAAAPKTHAELDALAEEQGHVWSQEGLTVAQKRAELGV